MAAMVKAPSRKIRQGKQNYESNVSRAWPTEPAEKLRSSVIRFGQQKRRSGQQDSTSNTAVAAAIVVLLTQRPKLVLW